MAQRRRRRKRRNRRGGAGFSVRPYLPYVLILLLLGGAYAFYVSKTPSGKQEAVCALIIDRTSSSNSPKTVARYKALAAKTVSGCADKKAALSVYYFDQNGPKLLLLNDQPYDLWGVGRKSSIREQSRSDNEKRATTDLGTVFRGAETSERGSDIVTALYGVAQNLNHDAIAANVSQKYLVVLTDGLQISDSITVSSLASGNSPVDPLLQRVKQLGLTPDLHGTQISFVGVRSGIVSLSGKQLPQVFEAKVQEFWTDVVRAGNGRLCTYVPDSTEVPVSC